MRLILACCGLLFLLAGCQEAQQNAMNDLFDQAAAPVVEQYLTAKVAGDRDAMAPLICASMESVLDMEAASFSAVEATIEGLDCTGNFANETVTCAGEIKAQYGLETRSFPLGTYAVTLEDGVWRWCGEAAG